ncbi:MAG: DNA repair protein RadA [Mycoplasmatales bacterium]
MKSVYVCGECGNEFAKWHGLCPKCRAIDSLFEQKLESKEKGLTQIINEPISFTEIKTPETIFVPTQIEEINKVMSGGFAIGSLNLLGGQPGIGKSTLMLQIIEAFEQANLRTLYASGEESLVQIKGRINRLKVKLEHLLLVDTTQIDAIIEQVKQTKAQVLIVDSIQTMQTESASGPAGSVNQIKASTMQLMHFCKQQNVTIFIIGHVTKDGDIAGPKLLEHMVDTVLYIEESKNDNLRFLRLMKNRYGTTEHLGVLKMTEEGLVSEATLTNYFKQSQVSESGVALGACASGNRVFFYEIQALLNRIEFGTPKRIAKGIDNSQVNLLLAIIQKRVNINLNMKDCYVKIVGEEKIATEELDLAIIMSIISSEFEQVIDKQKMFIGSVSLTGEINAPKKLEQMIGEASKLGITEIICARKPETKKTTQVQVTAFKHISEVVKYIFGG